jgi:hypothetical protein
MYTLADKDKQENIWRSEISVNKIGAKVQCVYITWSYAIIVMRRMSAYA